MGQKQSCPVCEVCKPCNCPACPKCPVCPTPATKIWPKASTNYIKKFMERDVDLGKIIYELGYDKPYGNEKLYLLNEFIDFFILGSIICTANYERWKNGNETDPDELVDQLWNEWMDATANTDYKMYPISLYERIAKNKFRYVYDFSTNGVHLAVKFMICLNLLKDYKQSNKNISFYQYFQNSKSQNYNPANDMPAVVKLKDYYVPHLHFEDTKACGDKYDLVMQTISNLLVGLRNVAKNELTQVSKTNNNNEVIANKLSVLAKKYGKRFDVTFMYCTSNSNDIVDQKFTELSTPYIQKECGIYEGYTIGELYKKEFDFKNVYYIIVIILLFPIAVIVLDWLFKNKINTKNNTSESNLVS